MVEYLTVENILTVIGMVVLIASVAAKVLRKVTRIRPSDRLKSTATTLEKWVGTAEEWLDTLAINSRDDD